MHIAVALSCVEITLPALQALHATFASKTAEFADIIKIGADTHAGCDTLTLGQEFSGYTHQIAQGIARLDAALANIYPLAQGGTAVGTGLNTPIGWDVQVAGKSHG